MPEYFEFEVELRGAKPRVWRRFMVPKKGTFLDLHQAIQDACGWLDYHLFNFFQKRPYGESLAGIPDEDGMDEYPVPDASRVKLSAFFGTGKGKKKTCGYLYDFGDDWIHKVTLKGTRKLADEFPRRLLAGERAFPREDCGGMGGYERSVEFVKTGKDPWDEDGEDTEELAEWLDGWHPDAFDLEGVKKEFDLGREATAELALAQDDVDVLEDPQQGIIEALAGAPEEMLKGRILATAAARGSTAPWLSIFPCQPPLGAEGCRGLYEVWLQEVPPGAGWRCSSCGEEGVITSLLDGALEMPPPAVRQNVDELPRVAMPPEEYDALAASDVLCDEDAAIIVGAGYEDGKVVIVGDVDEFNALHAALSSDASAERGKRRTLLKKLLKRIESALG